MDRDIGVEIEKSSTGNKFEIKLGDVRRLKLSNHCAL